MLNDTAFFATFLSSYLRIRLCVRISTVLETFFVSFNEIDAYAHMYNMRKCWLHAFMPALFEDIFSLLSFVLAVGIIVFVVLGIHTCILTDCSDLKSYSFKYRVRARGVKRAFRLTPKRAPYSLTDIC